MLHQDLVENLTKELKIAPLSIIRENLEMEILNEISQTKLASNLIFYGGTALRLAYNSFRFSEDLDFLLIKNLKSDKKELEIALNKVVENNQGIILEEVIEKRDTLFGLLKINHSLLKHSIRIKIEICKKKNGIKKENKLLVSPTTNLEVIFPTADLESLYKTKLEALKNRNLARDWFDLWYLNQKLDIKQKQSKKFSFNKQEFFRELKRFLPQNKWTIIQTVIKFYE
ncbi:nucleotidyl transferase AbiEii/AbiGii toxin family protein [Patescibacteria group bacterium]|nr:nucleotidyl transferase AbiEii/AbiGii toxin family protein [Patescibacteria group bacterium]